MPTPKKIILKVLKVLNYSRFKLLNLCRFAALRQPKVPILDSYLGFQNKHKSQNFTEIKSKTSKCLYNHSDIVSAFEQQETKTYANGGYWP